MCLESRIRFGYFGATRLILIHRQTFQQEEAPVVRLLGQLGRTVYLLSHSVWNDLDPVYRLSRGKAHSQVESRGSNQLAYASESVASLNLIASDKPTAHWQCVLAQASDAFAYAATKLGGNKHAQ